MNHFKLKLAAVVILTSALVACKPATEQVSDNSEQTTEINETNVVSDGFSLETQKAKLGYMYGVQAASQLVSSGLVEEIEIEAVLQAFRDITAGKEPQMTIDEMQATQAAFQQEQEAKFQAVSDENIAKGKEFLVANGAKEGVTTTESGLQYEILREGKGKQPADDSTVKVHYSGKLIDGTEFDSSYTRGEPVDFPVTGVIPGFSEGLLLMKEGAKYRLSIPAEIAYGEQGPASIGPNQTLIFEVELIEVL